MDPEQKIPLPVRPYFLFLDFLGAVLLGVGIARYFADVEIVPTALRFEHYDIAFMVAGVVLMLPAMVNLVTSAGRSGENRE